MSAAASRGEAEREMAYLQALNPGATPTLRPKMLELKRPVLAEDHVQRVADLDEKIYARGVAVDRDKLLALGRQRFGELLAADRAARTERVIGTRCDLSSFPSTYLALAQGGAQVTAVPAPTIHEQYQGIGKELDRARQVSGCVDLWKLSSEPRAVRYVYAFRDIFELLVFGQSLFTWIEDDSRIHHKFFRGDSGEKVHYFEQWLPALKGPHHRVLFRNSTAALLFWLAGEQSPLPDARDLAKEWFGVRAPSPKQINFAAALFDGFLLDHKGWNLWQHVGRATRTLPDRVLLECWSSQMQKRFRRIDVFHRQVAGFFLKPVRDHHEFEPARHRAFVNATLDQLLNSVSALAALTIEENSPADSAPVAARFRDWILCTGKPKPQLPERIAAKLEATFTGSRFKIEIE
jgi:hypothetical protein